LVAGSKRLGVGDLDGQGSPEIVVVDDTSLRILDPSGRERARLAAPGAIQVLDVSDLDADGRAEILAGWGLGRKHRDAPARASVLRLEGDELVEELIAEPETERASVVALLPVREAPGELLVAYFASKYEVAIAHARPSEGRWTLEGIEQIRMATSLVRGDLDHDGVQDLVVGRVYGDAKGLDGDAFLRRPDGTRVPIPIVGGVRSLAIVDLDGDGRNELLVGDGWNTDYGHVARARLTLARWEGEGFTTELLDAGEGQYTLWDIRALELEPSGGLEIITRGNAEVQVLAATAEGSWRARRVASACSDMLELGGDLGLWLACDTGVVRLP
jgi:hypothetical protein